MRWFRGIFLITCLVTTLVIVTAAIYARKEGFTESWRDAIEREFEKRGYHVEIGKVTLGAFRGLVAEDVRFYLDPEQTEEVAFLNDVYLDVDLSNIFNKKQVLINTLDVQDAKLSLPLDPSKPQGRKVKIEKLSGRVVVTESVIEILKAEATFAGIELRVKGSLLRSSEGKDQEEEEQVSEERAEELAGRRRQLLKVMKALDSFNFPGEPPVVDIEFRGDLDDISTATAQAKIRAGTFRDKKRTYVVDSLSADVEFDGLENEAEITELILQDKKGRLTCSGKWKQDGNRLDFSVDSDADLASLIGLFWEDKKLGEVVFFNPPEISVNGYLELDRFGEEGAGFPGEMLGEFRSERFVTRGSVFAGIDFGFSLAEDRYYLRNLRLDHKTGVAFLNLKYEPEAGDSAVQYQTEIKLDPKVFRPFFNEEGRKFIDSWSFDDTSSVYLAGEGGGPEWDMKTWRNRGVIDLRNFRLNGVPFLELETEIETEEGVQYFRNVLLSRKEGKIIAELAQNNVADKQWEVKGVVSTVHLVEGASAFNRQLGESLGKYRFENPPTVRLAGTLDARRADEVGDESRRTKVELSFESQGTALYDFLGKTLTLENAKGNVSIDRSRVHLTSLTAGTFGGNFELEYDATNVRSPDRPFETTLSVTGVPLEAVTKHYGDVDAIKGSVDTVFSLSGNAADLSSLQGQGRATISNGHLFALPVLGPLSKLISKGNGSQENAGHSVVNEATATFQIENGVLKTNDLVALAPSFRVRAIGDVSFVDQSIDMEAVVNTRDQLTSAILTPVSELLTFSGTGSIKEPVWKAKHISNLGKVPAQMISEMTNIPVEGLRKLGQGLFKNQASRAETGGETNTEVLPLKKLFQRREVE